MKGLKQARLAAGYKRKEVVALTGIAYSSMSTIENGVTIPTLTTRARLESFLGQRINWLDAPQINHEPMQFKCDWNECERTFRHLLHEVTSLPPEDQNDFLKSAIYHLRKIRHELNKEDK
jgi:transcriptional regulator with XRE-family HTH domain